MLGQMLAHLHLLLVFPVPMAVYLVTSIWLATSTERTLSKICNFGFGGLAPYAGSLGTLMDQAGGFPELFFKWAVQELSR